MKLTRQKNIVALALGLAATLTIVAISSFAAENASGSPDAAVERTRQEVKMLDDLFKNMMVLVDGHYVKKPSDFPAATAAKALWAALKKDGWYDVRILGLTDVIGDPDDIPRDAFEQTAAKKLLAGDASYEEVVEKSGNRYLRVATGIPVVSENCLMCHANFKGNKGNIGALSYTVPVVE
ncbi:MAG: c-type heme family protein [Methylocella sp.]